MDEIPINPDPSQSAILARAADVVAEAGARQQQRRDRETVVSLIVQHRIRDEGYPAPPWLFLRLGWSDDEGGLEMARREADLMVRRAGAGLGAGKWVETRIVRVTTEVVEMVTATSLSLASGPARGPGPGSPGGPGGQEP